MAEGETKEIELTDSAGNTIKIEWQKPVKRPWLTLILSVIVVTAIGVGGWYYLQTL